MTPSGQPRLKQPTHEDPLDMWIKYWIAYPDSMPPPLQKVRLPNRMVDKFVVRRNSVLKAMMPYYKRSKDKEDNPRRPMLDAAVNLFSIPGLFHAIVEADHLERAPEQNLKKIQSDLPSLSERDVAKWAAQCGISNKAVMQAERAARLYRNYDIKRPAEDLSPWPDHPATIDDVLSATNPSSAPTASGHQPPSRPPSRTSRRSASRSRSRSVSCPPNPERSRRSSGMENAPVVLSDKGKQREEPDDDTVSLNGPESPRTPSPTGSIYPD